jgi:putative protease
MRKKTLRKSKKSTKKRAKKSASVKTASKKRSGKSAKKVKNKSKAKRTSRHKLSDAKKSGLPTRPASAIRSFFSKFTGTAEPPATVYLGEIIHYFPQVRAGVIKIKKGPLSLGEIILIKGHTTKIKQPVKSMQIDRTPISRAKKGDIIGLRVKSRVRIGDKVYKA